MRVAALFDAEVIIRAHARQGGQFLATQTLDSSARAGDDPDILRADLIAAQLEVLAERITPGHRSRVLRVGLPDPWIIEAYPRWRCRPQTECGTSTDVHKVE